MIQDFDLHLHTNYSDGQYDLKTLLEKVKQVGVKVISVTDHDNIDSIKEIKKCNLDGIEFITGVEISSILDNKYKMHILGYYIDDEHQLLNSILVHLKEARRKRFIELVDCVRNQYGFTFSDEDIDSIVKNVNIPGKSHLAELMVKYNYVDSISQAFDKYLEFLTTKTSNRVSADLVIKAIKDAGGVAIWAHPKKVEKQYGISFESLIPRLLELGIDGIEAFNSLHSYDDCIRYLEFAEKNNLIVSGGSDYHGEELKTNVKIGLVYNSGEFKKIDLSRLSILEGIKNGK